MSMREKKAVLADYFRENGLPNGCITIDDDLGTMGNVSIGIPRSELMGYYFDEFIAVMDAYNEMHDPNAIKECYADDID